MRIFVLSVLAIAVSAMDPSSESHQPLLYSDMPADRGLLSGFRDKFQSRSVLAEAQSVLQQAQEQATAMNVQAKQALQDAQDQANEILQQASRQAQQLQQSAEYLESLATTRAKSTPGVPVCKKWTAKYTPLDTSLFDQYTNQGYEPYAAYSYNGVHLRKCETWI
ncbi:hypothetical protein MIR68_010837 [Amoeboaphelidium protococcarum]|nr:hypothetical protein MIR68_010837 [Amoeboaphelidium protococcarum]